MAKLLSGTRIYGNALVDSTLTAGNLAANSGITSTSTTTGALIITGGAGVSGNLNIGGTNNIIGGATTLNTITAGSFQGIIGNATPAAGTFTTVTVNSSATLNTVTAASINNTPIGNATPSTGAFTSLSSSTTATLNTITGASYQGIIGNATPAAATFTTATVNSTYTMNTGTVGSLQGIIGNATPAAGNFTTVTAANFASGNAVLTGGSINGATVGATTASTGRFTTLQSTDTTNATSATGTGAVQILGGAGIAKDLWVGGNVYANALVATTTAIFTVQDSLVYFQATGNAGGYSYDQGFYSDMTQSNYGHTGVIRNHNDNTWYFFSNVRTEPSGNVITWTDPGIAYDSVKAGNLVLANTTTSTSTTTGALIVGGGIGAAGNIYAGGGLNTSAGLYATGAYNGGYTGDGLVLEHSNSFGTSGARFSVGTSDGYVFYNGGIGTTELFKIDSTGNVVIAATTASSSTTTGALVVEGGAGIVGALNVGGAATISGATTLNTATTGSLQGIIGNVTPAAGTFTNISSATAPTNTVPALALTGTPNNAAGGKVGVLAVGSNFTAADKNIMASFVQNINDYTQIIVQNPNAGTTASADIVVNNDNTTGAGTYGDFGINSSGFTGTGSFNLANATYLYSVGGELVLGTQSANGIRFVINNGTTDSLQITSSNVAFNTQGTIGTNANLTIDPDGSGWIVTTSTTPVLIANALNVSGATTLSSNLAVSTATAAAITSGTATFDLFPSTVTLLRIGSATTVIDSVSNVQATSITTGAIQATGGMSITSGNLYIGGSGGNAVIATGAVFDDIGDVRDIPQNPQTANPYTVTVLDDGRHIYYTTNTGNVALPGGSVFSVGQAVTIVNGTATNITISQTTGSTIRLSGTATTGNRTLAQYGIATALCVVGGATPTWIVSGAGLT